MAGKSSIQKWERRKKRRDKLKFTQFGTKYEAAGSCFGILRIHKLSLRLRTSNLNMNVINIPLENREYGEREAEMSLRRFLSVVQDRIGEGKSVLVMGYSPNRSTTCGRRKRKVRNTIKQILTERRRSTCV